MTDGLRESIREIYREIAAGRGDHGDFVRSFAEAIIRADDENLDLLMNSALALVRKYNLVEGT